METVRVPILVAELRAMAERTFGDLVKAMVDVERGINLRPELYPEDDWIAFDSLINLRPWQANRSRGVQDETVRARIRAVVESLVLRQGAGP